MADSPHLVSVTAEDFDHIVIEGSHQRPVLVDFWAEWCAPCRSLMPILAKLAGEYQGKLLVAKVNTEEEKSLATEFGIRSLPTVQLFRDGRAADQFMGALPESQIREFLERHLPRESDTLILRTQARLDAGDLTEAVALLERARTLDPDDVRLLPIEAQLAAASGDTAGAEEMLARVPLEIADDPRVVALRGRLHFANLAAGAPPEDELSARLEADPNDHQARHELAAHRATQGDFGAALDHLLDLMKRNRQFEHDASRKGMLMIFDLLGGEGELVTTYRAKMLNALY